MVDAFMQSLGPEAEAVERLGSKEAGRQHLERLKNHLRSQIKDRGANSSAATRISSRMDFNAASQSNGEGMMAFQHDFIGGRVLCPLSQAGLKGDVRWTAIVSSRSRIRRLEPARCTLLRVYHTTQSDCDTISDAHCSLQSDVVVGNRFLGDGRSLVW